MMPRIKSVGGRASNYNGVADTLSELESQNDENVYDN